MYWLKGHGHTGNPTFMLVGMWCLGLVAGRGKREKGREGKGERVRIEKSGGGGRKEGKQLDFIIIPGLFIFMRTYVGHDRPTYGSAYLDISVWASAEMQLFPCLLPSPGSRAFIPMPSLVTHAWICSVRAGFISPRKTSM